MADSLQIDIIMLLWVSDLRLQPVNKMETYASGVWINSTSEGAEVTAVTCYPYRRLIKTKTQTLPAAPLLVFCFATCQALRPLERRPRQNGPFEDCGSASLAFWSALPGESAAASIQGRSLDWDSRGVGRRGEMHSTLINTWSHYLSHVAESHWGKFNTALLSRGMVAADHVCVSNLLCLHLKLWITAFVHQHLLFCVYIYQLGFIPVRSPCVFLSMRVCGCMNLNVWARLCVGLDSLWCQDSIKSFNIAIMRGCLILSLARRHSVFQSRTG